MRLFTETREYRKKDGTLHVIIRKSTSDNSMIIYLLNDNKVNTRFSYIKKNKHYLKHGYRKSYYNSLHCAGGFYVMDKLEGELLKFEKNN